MAAGIRTTRRTYGNGYTRITETAKCLHCGENINRRVDLKADEADKMWCHMAGNKRYLLRCDTPDRRGGGAMAEPKVS